MKSSLLLAVVGSSLIGCLAGTSHAAEKMTPNEMKITVGQAKIAGEICKVHDPDIECVQNLGFASGAGECESKDPKPYSTCVTDPDINNPKTPTHYCPQSPTPVLTCKVSLWAPADANGVATGATDENCRTGGTVRDSFSDQSKHDSNGC